jgi:hypothetical protein
MLLPLLLLLLLLVVVGVLTREGDAPATCRAAGLLQGTTGAVAAAHHGAPFWCRCRLC